MKSQPVDWASANPNTPRLSIRKALEKPIGCTQTIIANLKFTCLDIDRHNLVPMVLLNLKPDFGFIERIAALRKFFFAISGFPLSGVEVLPNCHGFDLATT
jgi:hypothetical protein